MDNIIWLIDDDESIRESMAFLLSGMGWEVKTFGSIDACRRAFRNGVFEFFTKPLDADKLIESVGLACEESQRRFADWQALSRIKARFEQLTAREHEVLAVLIEGLSNKEVAARLNLSPRTVEAHRAAAFAKLGVTSLVQASREYDKLQSV